MSPLTRPVEETIIARLRADASFRHMLLAEAVQCLVDGEMEVAKVALCDIIVATLGFDGLAAATGSDGERLRHMFAADSDPQARDLVAVIAALQREAGQKLTVSVEAA